MLLSEIDKKITSPFGPRGNPPIPHNATDFGFFPTGTPVFAVADGIVGTSKYDPTAGEFIRLHHQNVHDTRYLHLHTRLVDLGDFVQAGQQIGTLGNTGNSTGPHLHFEVRINDIPVNPYPYLTNGKNFGPRVFIDNEFRRTPTKNVNGVSYVYLRGERGDVWVNARELATFMGYRIDFVSPTVKIFK